MVECQLPKLDVAGSNPVSRSAIPPFTRVRTSMGRESTDAELARLCSSCGLCCDGSLFGRVDLASDEVDLARKHRLKVVPSGTSFEQPCSALVRSEGDERSCSIYAERPGSCRRFTCRLLARHRDEGGPLEQRLQVVRHVRRLLVSARDAEVGSAHADLTRILEEDFARA